LRIAGICPAGKLLHTPGKDSFLLDTGRIMPSTILRRLATYSRKSKLHFALRELGHVVRTRFLLESWRPFGPKLSFETNIVPPSLKRLEGFDVITFFAGNSPECSPLSCNSLAEELPTNHHCLFATFDEAEKHLN
jgi:Tn3 transposase DDE domain